MAKSKKNITGPELPRKHSPEGGADRLDFKQNLILWTVLRARDSDDQIFRQTSRKLLEEYIHTGIITRDFLKPIYDSLGLGDNFDDRKLSPSIIQDELIPLDQELLQEEIQEQETNVGADENGIEMPQINPDEIPTIYRLQDTILPADDKPQIKTDGEHFEHARQIPRAEILTRLLLDSEFECLPETKRVNKKDITIVTGKNDESMVRQESYQLFLIRGLNKMVFVCNEQSNNTFVINGIVEGIDSSEDIQKLEPLYNLKKSELKELKNLDLLEEVRWGKKEKWEERLKVVLQKDSTLVGPIEEWLKIIGGLENSEGNLEMAPEGWMTNFELMKKLGRTYTSILKIADKYRSGHPEWFKEYLNKNNRKLEHYSPELITLIEEELISTESAPEGWMTNFELMKKLGRSQGTIQKITDKYRSGHNKWFKEYLNKNNRKLEHYSPELITLIEKELTSTESAPEGWMTNHELSKRLRISHKTAKKNADKYRSDHPEWFKEYLDKNNRKLEHYSPELITLIEEELTSIESAPEGWMTNTALAEKLKRGSESISNIADRHRSGRPEWFKEYLNKNNNKTEYYSPELVTIIKEELTSIEPVPEGWMTNPALAEKLSKSKDTIRKIADKYHSDHPEWFKEYLDIYSKRNEYYSPELVTTIEEELTSTEPAPEGWLTNMASAEKLKRSRDTIRKIADKYRSDHPERFKEYLDKSKHKLEHYSPELITLIKKELSSIESAPEGWMTNNTLANKVNRGKSLISRTASKYRKDHPEWFKKYLNKNNQKREHYSPELVAKIEEELTSTESAPEGWMTNTALIAKSNRGYQTIHNIADNHRPKHPEWFKEYLDKEGKKREHYSPELVAIITEELSRK